MDIATENMKTRLTVGKTTPMDQMHKTLGVRKNNLKRDGWLGRLDGMEDLIDKVDQEALAPLGALL